MAAAAPVRSIKAGRSPGGSWTVAGDEPEAPRVPAREALTLPKASDARSPVRLKAPSPQDRTHTRRQLSSASQRSMRQASRNTNLELKTRYS